MSNKTILVVAEGDSDGDATDDDYFEPEVRELFGDNNTLILKEIDPSSGDNLRGYDADLVVLTTAVSANVRQRVLEPMTAIGGEIIELY